MLFHSLPIYQYLSKPFAFSICSCSFLNCKQESFLSSENDKLSTAAFAEDMAVSALEAIEWPCGSKSNSFERHVHYICATGALYIKKIKHVEIFEAALTKPMDTHWCDVFREPNCPWTYLSATAWDLRKYEKTPPAYKRLQTTLHFNNNEECNGA